MKENKLNNLLDNEEVIDLRLSYSKVSDFDRNGPISLIRRNILDGEGVKHGSLVDVRLTDKLSNTNEFDKKFIVMDIQKPTATTGALCDIILDNYTEVPSKEEILKIVNNNPFWKRSSDEVKINNFDTDEFWNYLKAKISSQTLTIVNNEQLTKADEAVTTLLEHPFTKDMFDNGLENHYQVEFNMVYRGFTFKGFLDKMTIDRENKIVYFEDIKTGEPKNNKFIESFIKYRYYFQALLYNMAFDVLAEKYNFKDYKLAPFTFIYVGKTENHPLVYVMNEKWEKAAKKGFTTIGGYKYKGLDELLDDIYYHWKNQKYEFSKEIYEQKGTLNLKDDFIEVNE